MNWSHVNVWAPAAKLAAAIRARMAFSQSDTRRSSPTRQQDHDEPQFRPWAEYEPIGSSPAGGKAQASQRVRAWRRRVLLRKGASLHAKMGPEASAVSLAILDEFGMVVAWYDRDQTSFSDEVLRGHLTQFYIPTDVGDGVPAQHLSAAVIDGSSSRCGWRRRCDGRVFWGSTVITPIFMRDGRLQGYAHLTREVDTNCR